MDIALDTPIDSTGSPLAFTGAVAKGAFLCVCVGDGFGYGEKLSSLVDSRGNIYTIDYSIGNTSGDGDLSFAHTLVTRAIAPGDTLTPTWSFTGPISGHLLAFTVPGVKAVGDVEAVGFSGDGQFFATATANPHDTMIGIAISQGTTDGDPADGWSTWYTGGDGPDNQMVAQAQTTTAGGIISFGPVISANTGFGVALLIALGITGPPPAPTSPVIDLGGQLDAHWTVATAAPLGYYIHKGRIYLTGAVQPVLAAGGSYRTVYTGLPLGIRPGAPQALTLPMVRTGWSLVTDPGLNPPGELAATIHPDGTLTLDDELFQYFITAPSVADYWYYTPSAFSPHTPAGPQKYPRYPGPFPCVMALGNASWPRAPKADNFTPVSLAGFLDADATDEGSGYFPHQERDHLSGEVAVASTSQQTSLGGATAIDPWKLTDVLPSQLVSPLGLPAFTTVRRALELWAAEVSASGVVTLPQPFNYGKVPSGHSPWLVSEVPAPQPPGNTDSWFYSTTNPNNRNYVGYTDALGVGTVDGGLAGENFRVPSDQNLPDITFTFDIDALLAMVAPRPDWFALEFNFDWVTGAQDPSSIVGSDFNQAGGHFTIVGPFAAQTVNGQSPSAGFLVPTAPSYVGADFVPAWQDHPWYPIPPWNFGEIGLIPEPPWLWRTADWPGGSFSFTPHTLPPYFFYMANVTWAAMTIVPFWELPDTGFIQAGDAIDLNGTGWEGVLPAFVGEPGLLTPGAGSQGHIRHLPVHGNAAGSLTLKTADGRTIDSRNQLSGGQGGSHGFVRYPRPR